MSTNTTEASFWPGLFVAFEGIDGAGKTTQVSLLVESLIRSGHDVLRTKEPTDGVWGQKIRSAAHTHRLPYQEELAAFINDRREHVQQRILPALQSGAIVVTDRYLYSTAAYQGIRGQETPCELLQRLTALAPTPDIVFLVDVPPEVGLNRVAAGRGDTPDAFETIANLTAVRNAFLSLKECAGDILRCLDGTQSSEVLQEKIAIEVESLLSKS